jgi:hypothetical protein
MGSLIFSMGFPVFPRGNPATRFVTVAVLLSGLIGLSALAQPVPQGERATVIRVSSLYVAPDDTSQRVGQMTPGREMIISEHSGKWLRVFANTDVEEASEKDAPVFGQEAAPPPVSGWTLAQGVVAANTPHGDAILFGEAASAEVSAAEPHAPTRAAQDARLLYRRLVDLFPQSPLNSEAMWRAADIRWQLQKADAFSRPSGREKDNLTREQIDDEEMKKIEKKLPGTRWADNAAWDRLDNKICGDWQGATKCPEKETEIYEKYAQEHPNGPHTAEALYDAVYRQAALVDLYKASENGKKAEASKAHAIALAGQLTSRFAQSDYAARASGLVYKLEQSIPVYGSDRD